MNLTENNHNSMKTVVETFLTEETVDLIYDNEQLEKWNSHIESLGVVGQTKIRQKDKSPIPFMHLKTSYANICSQLCPKKVWIEDYNISPIPVEILDLIALSKKENYFNKMQIWYDEKSPDPFAIGIVYETIYTRDNENKWDSSCKTWDEAVQKHKDNGWDKNTPHGTNEIYYLLGKWADVKHSWKELKEMAIERFKAEKGNTYHKEIKEAKRGLEDLEIEAFEKFN